MKSTFLLKQKSVVAVISLLLGLAVASGYAADLASSTNAVPPGKAGNLPVVGVKDFLKDPQSYVGKKIVLQGFVTDICKRRGCWALLHDNDANAKGQVRVKQNEASDMFRAFLPDLQGKTILVTGEVKETKIDNDYLDKWEANVKAAKEKAGKAGDKESEEGDSYDAILKQIASLRERVAKAKQGHLSSYSLAVAGWEPQAEKP
jgi:hypothetical protein